MKLNSFQRFSLIALAGIILITSFFIILPLITPILSGAILAFLFYPLYVYMEGVFSKPSNNTGRFSALFVVFTIICFVLVPLSIFISLLISNLPNMRKIISMIVPLVVEEINSLIASVPVIKQFFNQFLSLDISRILSTATEFLFKLIQDLVTSFPNMLFGAFLTLYITYYILRNADPIIKFLQNIIPVSRKQTVHILNKFNGLARGVVLSQLMIAFVQGILMTIGCIILGLGNSFFIGLITIILAIIPFMGAVVVWVTIALFLFVTKAPGWQIVFILCYGSLLISTVDNFIRPKIMSDASQINPAVALVGFIGGFLLFGLPGILLGPFILALIELALEIFREIT